MVELGYLHGNGELLKRAEFDSKKQAIAEYRLSLLNKKPKPLLGAGKQLAGHPLLQVCGRGGCLASRGCAHSGQGLGQELAEEYGGVQREMAHPNSDSSQRPHPNVQAIAERELAIRDGSLATIIFIRVYNSRGQEVSGYIDLGHRCGQQSRASWQQHNLGATLSTAC